MVLSRNDGSRLQKKTFKFYTRYPLPFSLMCLPVQAEYNVRHTKFRRQNDRCGDATDVERHGCVTCVFFSSGFFPVAKVGERIKRSQATCSKKRKY